MGAMLARTFPVARVTAGADAAVASACTVTSKSSETLMASAPKDTAPLQIGMIGLGKMGSAIAARLLSSGHKVRVWNRSPEPVKELVAQGAEAAAQPG